MRYWDKAWSLVDGCTPCSPGCDHCWLHGFYKRFMLTDPSKVIERWDRLEKPVRRKKPTTWAVWSDLFHERVTPTFQAAALEVMRNCAQHTFIVLTKRAAHFERVTYDAIPNVWMGMTVCNHDEAEKKIPAIVNGYRGNVLLSIEPCLGPIRLSAVPEFSRVGAVILGAETGNFCRWMSDDWARLVRDECAAAGVPFLLKKLHNGRTRLDGREHLDMPWRNRHA